MVQVGLFKASDWAGTILALLGVAFRFLTLLVRRMRRLWAGFTKSRPFFLFACLRLLTPQRRGRRLMKAPTNKSLALMSKTPEIGPGIVKGLARSTAFNWATSVV